MGGRGGSSGIKPEKTKFPSVSLDGKTGSEKQKEYAQNLVDSMVLTARANGIEGFHERDGSAIRSHTSRETAEEVTAAYKFLTEAIKNRKTYGEVIDLLKYESVLDLGSKLRIAAKKKNVSILRFVDDMIKKGK